MILRHLGKREWALFAASIVFIVLQVYLDLRIPEYMSQITLALENGTSTDAILDCGIGMLACALLSMVVSLTAGYLIADVASSLSRKLRLMMLDQVQRFSPEDVDRFSIASLITRSTNDISQVQQFVGRALQVTVKSPIMAVWAIMKISGSAWEWTFATAIAVVVLTSVILFVIWRSMKYYKKIQILNDAVNRETRESITGIRVVRAYNAEEFQAGKFDIASDDLLINNMSVLKIMFPMFTMTSVVTNFLTLSIYWIGAGLIMATGNVDSQMTLFADMIVFSSYAIQVLRAFVMVTEIVRAYPQASVSAKRVEEVINSEPRIKDGTEDGGDSPGEIEFRNVSFSYPNSEAKVLDDVSFKVSRGQTLAVIGPTGCGKSTLVKLMQRIYDASSGQILVDGMDVKEYRRDSLGSRFSYVPQKSIIFTGTIRDNVNYGDTASQRDDSDVWRALEVSQASEFVKELPDGLEATVSQQGKNLSGGQRQRISIARAVCRRAEICILDDSFSALDFKTDKAVRTALKKELEGSTIVMVAQRIGTIMDADVIVVLDGGKVVGIGTHKELMEGCELYREIAISQMTEGTI
ncbi:MAG: ABC transporter ATP-binding protein [Candidatus Methanomethylophilaceae archaeon]|nr:ABC transporter ATP-binding protein [Candidatus Methanomethylophilaceae archaeon]